MSIAQRPDTVERAFGVPAPRTPVQFDPATGGLRIGVHERRVDASQPSSVYNAYLSLLYAVRGAKPGQRLPLRSADLEALLLIVGDDPGTIEQRLVGLMGCSLDEAKALTGILLRHRKLTATLGIAATLSLGAAAVADTAGDAPGGAELTRAAMAPADTTATVQSRRATEQEATAPTVTVLVPSGTTSVVVAEAAAPVVAPARARTTAPQAPSVAPAPAAPVAAPPAPVAAVPAPRAPVAPAPVVVPAPVDGWPAPPAADVPPAVEGGLPDAGIGDPAYEEAVPTEEIGGIADPSIGHEQPVAQPDVALPFPNAPRVEVVIGPELVLPVDLPEVAAPAPVDAEKPAVEDGLGSPVEDDGSSAGDEPKA